MIAPLGYLSAGYHKDLVRIVFKDVHFGYKEQEVLHGIDLTIKEGTVNALVGPSGSGKSTIAKLIASFWDVDSGEIDYGGVGIKEIPLDEYNKYIGYVSQDNYLFDETVMENIRMGRPGASDEEVMNAAKACGCHDFIMQLENAPVVILDEATAYTDPENEAELSKAIDELTKNKTIIMIAHRLKTVRGADQILVVANGKITQMGTHEDLMAVDGIYKDFVSERKEAVSWKIA